MQHGKRLIHITDALEESHSMYSRICLKASALYMMLSGARCFLDGHYLGRMPGISGKRSFRNTRLAPFTKNMER